MNKYTLDRFEGEFAVLIDSEANSENVSRHVMPENAVEGDSLIFDGNIWSIDYEHTQRRREIMQSRFDRLKKK